jgi:NTP pyrophosphatase (non-canonical NTP hydrolase)
MMFNRYTVYAELLFDGSPCYYNEVVAENEAKAIEATLIELYELGICAKVKCWKAILSAKDVDETPKLIKKGKVNMSLNELAKKIHQNAVNHGWWENERSLPEIIALCHSELSEALEEYRNGHNSQNTYYSCTRKYKENEPTCNTNKTMPYMCEGCSDRKPEGIPTELADCIIRILDYCGHAGIDIQKVLEVKHEYNKTRPWRHNGKVL